MGLDIIIQRKPDDILNLAIIRETTIYHATYEATDFFREQSAAFKVLTDFAYATSKDKVKVVPEQYSPLIQLFADEKAELESLGKADRGDPDNNEITLYDCVVGCYEGLQKASEQGKNILIS